jgi:mRNA-degrading endonuclease YafQ of YafQ-DinJ toxin-antitoxin module
MIKIAFSSSFKRAFKKKIKDQKDLENKYWEKLKIFILGKTPSFRSDYYPHVRVTMERGI